MMETLHPGPVRYAAPQGVVLGWDVGEGARPHAQRRPPPRGGGGRDTGVEGSVPLLCSCSLVWSALPCWRGCMRLPVGQG
jgi:hypothetical protein